MMKFYQLLLFGSALIVQSLSADAASMTVPYTSAIGDKSIGKIDENWKITDHNKDNTTWEYDSDGNDQTAVTGFNAGI